MLGRVKYCIPGYVEQQCNLKFHIFLDVYRL